MSFKDVDGVEVNLTLVLLGQFVQDRNLPPKGRSRKAAEDEDNRLLAPKGCQTHGRSRIECLDGEIGGGIANLKGAFTRLCPHRLEREEKVRRHRHSCHDMPEDFGWLAHGPIDISDEAEPKAEEHCQRATQQPFCVLLHRHQPKLTWSSHSFRDTPVAKCQRRRPRD